MIKRINKDWIEIEAISNRYELFTQLVNINHITGMAKKSDGWGTISLTDNITLLIRNYEEFKKALIEIPELKKEPFHSDFMPPSVKPSYEFIPCTSVMKSEDA